MYVWDVVYWWSFNLIHEFMSKCVFLIAFKELYMLLDQLNTQSNNWGYFTDITFYLSGTLNIAVANTNCILVLID